MPARNEKYTGEGKERRNQISRAYRERNPARSRLQWHESRIRRLEAKAGRKKPPNCELCGRKGLYGEADRICFDHDHKTGQFRGWLCHHCNLIIGHCNDDPVLLRKLADYLEYHLGLRRQHESSLRQDGNVPSHS